MTRPSALLLIICMLALPGIARAEGAAHPAIGRIERDGAGGCAGTLVGPRHVLTAGHCLLQPRTRLPLPAARLRFVLPEGAFTARAAILGDGYRPGSGPDAAMLPRDWGVLVLDRAPAATPLPLLPRSLQGLTDMVGRRQLRLGTGAGDACALTNIGQDPALLLHDCPVTPGDSGAPLLVGEGADTAVLGVQVAILGFGGRPHTLALSAAALADGVARIVAEPSLR